jgi:hypothetical protein
MFRKLLRSALLECKHYLHKLWSPVIPGAAHGLQDESSEQQTVLVQNRAPRGDRILT